MADTLVKSGMKDLGYDHIVLDDCWHPSRDEKTGVRYKILKKQLAEHLQQN